MRTIKIHKWEVKAIHVERVIAIKLIVGLGIIAAVVLPGQIAAWIGAATNIIWLTKL
jgi:hypothetical protein